MRTICSIALAGLLVASCADGDLHWGGDAAPSQDAGARADAPPTDAPASTPHDAGNATDGARADSAGPALDAASPPRDSGPAGPDVVTAHDAGPGPVDVVTPPPVDAGPPPTDGGPVIVDAGPAVPGDTCAAPIDVSAGGMFMVDTCTLGDNVAASCGSAGGADVVVRGDAPRSGSTYRITVPAGWLIQQVDSACTPMPFSCSTAGSWGVSGATFDSGWFFAVERTDGTCGAVTITVERVM